MEGKIKGTAEKHCVEEKPDSYTPLKVVNLRVFHSLHFSCHLGPLVVFRFAVIGVVRTGDNMVGRWRKGTEGLQRAVVVGVQWWDEGGELFVAPRNFFSRAARCERR